MTYSTTTTAPQPVIAQWEVGAETYAQMLSEAESDAQLFMHGLNAKDWPWQYEVLACQPTEYEGSRIIKWRGKAIIYLV